MEAREREAEKEGGKRGKGAVRRTEYGEKGGGTEGGKEECVEKGVKGKILLKEEKRGMCERRKI